MTNPYDSLTNAQLADKLSEVWADANYEQHAALLETVIARLQATDSRTIYVVELDNGDDDSCFAGAFTAVEPAIEWAESASAESMAGSYNQVYEWRLNQPLSQYERLKGKDVRE